jgi:hypothetical protein
MADHTITVSNSINLFGPSPTYWGSGNMVWTTDKWGEGSRDLTVSVEKLIENSLSSDSDVHKNVTHTLDFGSLSFSDDATGDLDDSSGYDYVYTRPTTNPDLRVSTSYQSATANNNSWTSGSVSSTSWSSLS